MVKIASNAAAIGTGGGGNTTSLQLAIDANKAKTTLNMLGISTNLSANSAQDTRINMNSSNNFLNKMSITSNTMVIGDNTVKIG